MPDSSAYPRRHHPRLAGHDYSAPGYYFATICVQDRLHLFGSVKDGVMQLSPAGQMVLDAWDDLTPRHPGVTIDTVVALPDHVHAIVVLEDDPRRRLSLPDVLHRYKSLTTKRYAHGVREEGWPRYAGQLWQDSYHDRGIRDERELGMKRKYMQENALRWDLKVHGER